MTFSSSTHPPQSFIQSVFSRVAARYDMMNDLMSFGSHRLWKKKFVQSLSLKPEMKILDVATGTGDVLRLLVDQVKRRNLTGTFTAVDLNESMLREGHAKFINKGILTPVRWIVASAEELPLENDTHDLYTIAFGLRNVGDREKALSEAYRVLRPGGQLACLEFSHVQKESLRGLYEAYSRHVIPRIGKWVAHDEEAYRYLVESIWAFPDANQVAHMMKNAGFQTASYELLSGGVVAIHWAWK